MTSQKEQSDSVKTLRGPSEFEDGGCSTTKERGKGRGGDKSQRAEETRERARTRATIADRGGETRRRR